jgi:Ca-activated chloride channel family protein
MMSTTHKHRQRSWIRWFIWVAAIAFVAILIIGTVTHPHFWLTADQRGEMLFREKRYADAAKAYADPWHAAQSQYHNGDFEAAAKTYARVPGATGAFDQGNAWLMHGQYDAAVASYDRALGFHPGWKEAEENKALALARKKLMEISDKDREKEATEAYKPDKIVFDQKGGNKTPPKPLDLGAEKMSDEELRASWLRRVQTTPGDFLRAKFAYQASRADAGGSAGGKEAAK